jgi:hypothetical protein
MVKELCSENFVFLATIERREKNGEISFWHSHGYNKYCIMIFPIVCRTAAAAAMESIVSNSMIKPFYGGAFKSMSERGRIFSSSRALCVCHHLAPAA